jgi:hypothetical protein
MQPARCLCTVHTSRPGDQGRGLGACLAGPLHRRPRASKEPAHAGLAPTLHRRPRASPPRPQRASPRLGLLRSSTWRSSTRASALKHLVRQPRFGCTSACPNPPSLFPSPQNHQRPRLMPPVDACGGGGAGGMEDGGWRMEAILHPPSIKPPPSRAHCRPPCRKKKEQKKNRHFRRRTPSPAFAARSVVRGELRL